MIQQLTATEEIETCAWCGRWLDRTMRIRAVLSTGSPTGWCCSIEHADQWIRHNSITTPTQPQEDNQ